MEKKLTFEKIFEVKAELTKKDLIRKTLLKLSNYSKLYETNEIKKYKSVNAIDLNKLQFKNFKLKYFEIIKCHANIKLDVEASIGFYEEIYDRVNPLDVMSRRTITRWTPLQKFHIETEKVTYGYNNCDSDDILLFEKNIKKYINKLNQESLTELDPNKMDVNLDIYNAIEDFVVISALKNESPGDDIKDEIYSGSINTELFCYLIPYYDVTFMYDDNEYTVPVFSSESFFIIQL